MWLCATPRFLTSFQTTDARRSTGTDKVLKSQFMLLKFPSVWHTVVLLLPWFSCSSSYSATTLTITRLPKFLLQPLLWDVHLAIWREGKGPSWWELNPLLGSMMFTCCSWNAICKAGGRAEWGMCAGEEAFRWFVIFPMSNVKAKCCINLYVKSLTNVGL